jgi:hypothetical protein
MSPEVKPSNPGLAGNYDRALPPARFALMLVVLIAISFPDVVFGADCFVLRDFGLFGYPLASFHRECFWRGEIPLWNPLNNCGIPFLAQWNTLALYPLSLIYLLLPLPWSLGYYCLAHLFLAGMGMFYLSRRWSGNNVAAGVAGVGYAFNGLALNCLAWPNNLAALAWMPWVALATELAWQRGGRYIAIAALAGGAQMLSGAPEFIILSWALVGLVFCFQLLGAPDRFRMCLRAGGVVALVSGLAAAQLLPFLDLLARSQRDTRFGAGLWSMPPWGWANLVVPLFRCTESPLGVFFQDSQYWTSSYYLGAGLLALGIAGAAAKFRHARPLAAAALASLVLALGDHGFLHPALLRLFPFLGFMRYPIKFVALAMFALPPLAALGVAAGFAPGRPARFFPRGWIPVFALLAAAALFLAWVSFHYPVAREQPLRVLWNVLSRVGLVGALLLVLAVATRTASEKMRFLLPLAAVLLAWLDPITHAPDQNPAAPAAIYAPNLVSSQLKPAPTFGASRGMQSRQTNERLHGAMAKTPADDYLASRSILLDDCNLLDQLPLVDGFYSLYLREERDVWSGMFFAPTNAFPDGLADFIGVSQLTDRQTDFQFESRPGWQPLVAIGRRPVFMESSAILPALLKPQFNPRQTVLLSSELKGLVPADPPAKSAVLAGSYGNQRVSVNVATDGPALLTVAQTFHHAWKPFVDGRAVRLFRVNHAFQGLVVPAGRHRVEIVFRDDIFRAGACVSAVALAVCAGMLWSFRRARGAAKS